MKLSSSVSAVPFVGPVYVRRLAKLEITSVKDLILHAPHRYNDLRNKVNVRQTRVGDIVTIRGNLSKVKNLYTRAGKKIQTATLSDDTGSIPLVWFNQPYLARTLSGVSEVFVSGKVDWWGKEKAIISPEYELIKGTQIHTGRLVPIYPETYGISSKWIRSRMASLLPSITSEVEEFIPDEDLKNLNLIEYQKSVLSIHFPETEEEASKARKRLSFNELLNLHMRSMYRKEDWNKSASVYKLEVKKELMQKFLESLPFTLTPSQTNSIKEIFEDFKADKPMNRLLEGDVGSGKTVVAASGAFAAFLNGYQSIFMAPTQILAEQHYQTLQNIFSQFKVRVSLVTSAGIKSDLGKTDIFVGTHALIQKKKLFEKVAYVVIDEQHRFGVEQRALLAKKAKTKNYYPHILTMTATPIPRTIALTVYGDLELSTLRELPQGRKPITTFIVPPQKREAAYGWIEKEIKTNHSQAYIICPLIEESEIETMKQVKAATKEFEELKKIFKSLKLGLLHGKIKAEEKNKIISEFKAGKIDILVSTPVVEVGIDVPNATIMMIEGAERFGLSQLHQLRGRVGRGGKKSYCLLFTESRSPRVQERLNALRSTLSGFELAEMDLKLRGPGEIFGTKQSGFQELKIASWSDFDLIKKSKELAEKALKDKEKYKKLLEEIKPENISMN